MPKLEIQMAKEKQNSSHKRGLFCLSSFVFPSTFVFRTSHANDDRVSPRKPLHPINQIAAAGPIRSARRGPVPA
jgi:hypothetical protein